MTKFFGCARNESLFVAHLLTKCAISKTEHEPQGGEPLSAELASHTSPIAIIAINCNHLHFGLGVPLSHAPKTALSSYNASTSSLVFDAQEPLCVKYKRLRRVVGYCLAHKAQWHNE